MPQNTPEPLRTEIVLRDVTASDLPIFFEQQLDADANYMAAFTAKNPANRDGFMLHWQRFLGDETITIKTILFAGQVAGHILSYEYEEFAQPEVGYWIGKPFWGKGVATAALAAFLQHVTARPIYARAAKDNLASLRVLQKCGFTLFGEGKGFSNARNQQIEELILIL